MRTTPVMEAVVCPCAACGRTKHQQQTARSREAVDPTHTRPLSRTLAPNERQKGSPLWRFGSDGDFLIHQREAVGPIDRRTAGILARAAAG